jgi:hypothetical protein
MAKIGKITITVTQSRNQQSLHIATTGSRGAVPLNTVTADVTATSQSPSPDAPTFWEDVLTRAIAAI